MNKGLVVLGVGAVVLSGIAVAKAAKAEKPTVKRKPEIPPVVNHADSPRKTDKPAQPPAPPAVVDSTPAGNLVIVTQPTTAEGKPTATFDLATNGVAVPEARALYDLLKAKGVRRSTEEKKLVLAFQRAHNSDPRAVAITKRLDEDGLYGKFTSAALTLYTGNPVVAPSSGATTVRESIGAAASTGSNLYAYLKANGDDRTPGEKPIVLAFQRAVNSDPLFPGPQWKDSATRVIKARLAEDGVYGPKTADALTAITYDRIAPRSGPSRSTPPVARRGMGDLRESERQQRGG